MKFKLKVFTKQGCGKRKLLKQFLQKKKLDERQFRQFDYVLILFLIVTLNTFLK